MKRKGKISENNFNNLFIVAFTRFNDHVQENTLITSICTVNLIIVFIYSLDLKIQLKELQRFSGV